MVINKINGKDVVPLGKQKTYLLKIFNYNNSPKCNMYGINYNGYGYSDWVRDYALTKDEVDEYNALLPAKNKPKKSYEEREQSLYAAWTKRLSILTGITIEEAEAIADEKLDYKYEQIDMMVERHNANPSRMRDKLISKMKRANPLRRIEDASHAQAILAASNRHKNTDYEALLEEGREKAASGEIDRGEVKDFARQHFKSFGGVINDAHISLGTAKELNITPTIKKHDMIAECGDCGDKFSYQNSKNYVLWECPECKSIKRIS